jgi:hypothetical protein
LASGGGVEFVTHTLPHDEGDNLTALFSGVTGAWAFVSRDWAVREQRHRGLLIGSVRALEVTHGVSGWHPHLHVLMFMSHPLTPEERCELRRALLRAWVVGVQRQGWRPPSETHGVTVEQVTTAGVGDYVSKMSAERVANYLVRLVGKGGEGKGRTPWQILAGAGELIATDVALWREYESATRGRRMLTWTKGLKALLAVGEDELVSEVDAGPEEEWVAELLAFEWELVLLHRSGIVWLLRAAEDGGAEGVKQCIQKLRSERPKWLDESWWTLDEAEEETADPNVQGELGLYECEF